MNVRPPPVSIPLGRGSPPTLLVATALGETPDELYAQARKAEPFADLIEIRLDGPSGLPWDLRAFFAHGKPTLATVRHADDGGRSHADDKTRNDILRRALRAGASSIDVEVGNEEARPMIREAHEAGAKVVVSWHADETPDAARIIATLREMQAMGADWCKVATRMTTPQDAAALLEAARDAHAAGIPYALMAVNDAFLRFLAPSLGMALAYGSAPGASAAVPGQAPLDALRAFHARGPLAPASTTAATRHAYVIGSPMGHSLSPAMHNAAFRAAGIDACYLALEVAPPNLDAALAGFRASPPLGVSVTLPHKVAILALADVVSPTARQAGAANTLVFRDGRIEAHNTDGAGALDALAERGIHVGGKEVLVLGAGGAGRGVAQALADAGAQVTVANRTRAKATATGHATLAWDEVQPQLPRFSLVVHCTSIGLRDDAMPFDPKGLGSGCAVLDAVYHPGGTRLTREARARGHVVVPGEAMLLHQGARAFTLWTGVAAPVDAMRRVIG